MSVFCKNHKKGLNIVWLGNATSMQVAVHQDCRLYFLCYVHLLICWKLCVTYICCICLIESLSSAVSVELRHSHLLYRLNWVTLISCIGCFKSLSSAVSVALFESRHLLYRFHCLSLAHSTLSVVLIVLYLSYFSCHVHCMPSFSITFDTTHPTCTYFNFFNFFYQPSFRRFCKTSKSKY